MLSKTQHLMKHIQYFLLAFLLFTAFDGNSQKNPKGPKNEKKRARRGYDLTDRGWVKPNIAFGGMGFRLVRYHNLKNIEFINFLLYKLYKL
jgi:hypothetical protein